MVQTIQDLRDKHTLDWNTAIVLYENSAISDEILNDIKETLSQKASVSTFEMGSNPAQSLPSILASLPSRQLGKYFFSILILNHIYQSFDRNSTHFLSYCCQKIDSKVLFTIRYTKRQITALTFFCHYKNNNKNLPERQNSLI